jgi:hypothetical protein
MVRTMPLTFAFWGKSDTGAGIEKRHNIAGVNGFGENRGAVAIARSLLGQFEGRGVSGCKQNPAVWIVRGEVRGEINAVHARQHDVGEDGMGHEVLRENNAIFRAVHNFRNVTLCPDYETERVSDGMIGVDYKDAHCIRTFSHCTPMPGINGALA